MRRSQAGPWAGTGEALGRCTGRRQRPPACIGRHQLADAAGALTGERGPVGAPVQCHERRPAHRQCGSSTKGNRHVQRRQELQAGEAGALQRPPRRTLRPGVKRRRGAHHPWLAAAGCQAAAGRLAGRCCTWFGCRCCCGPMLGAPLAAAGAAGQLAAASAAGALGRRRAAAQLRAGQRRRLLAVAAAGRLAVGIECLQSGRCCSILVAQRRRCRRRLRPAGALQVGGHSRARPRLHALHSLCHLWKHGAHLRALAAGRALSAGQGVMRRGHVHAQQPVCMFARHWQGVAPPAPPTLCAAISSMPRTAANTSAASLAAVAAAAAELSSTRRASIATSCSSAALRGALPSTAAASASQQAAVAACTPRSCGARRRHRLRSSGRLPPAALPCCTARSRWRASQVCARDRQETASAARDVARRYACAQEGGVPR